MSIAALDHTLGLLWIELLRHLWQTALVLVPLFFLAHVLRSAPARWSHRLWGAALVKLFVPMAMFGPLTGAVLQRLFPAGSPEPHASALGLFQVAVTAIGVGSDAGIGGAIDWFAAPFWTVCTVAYLVVASLLVVRTGRDLLAARRLAREDTPVTGDRLARLERAIQLAGVRRDLVCVSKSNVIPAVIGAIRPRIVLPIRLLDALNVDELEAVLLHEEMHRRNGDPVLSLLQRLASGLFFFFPLLGPMHRRLREAAEFRCDEEALRAGAEPQAYVRALARTIRLGLEPSPAPAALGDGNPSIVTRRLARLTEPRRIHTMTKHRVAIAAATAILAGGIFLPVAPARVFADPAPVIPGLGLLSSHDRRVSLEFVNAPAAEVLRAIATAGRFRLETEGSENCCLVSVSLTDVPLRHALEAVAAQTVLRYEVVGFDRLRVTLPSLAPPPAADVTLPHLLTKVEPEYPDDARRARVGGTVRLQAEIREDGSVGDVQVLTSATGWPSFDEAAVAAVRQWIYSPAMKDGRPVSVSYTVVITFSLR